MKKKEPTEPKEPQEEEKKEGSLEKTDPRGMTMSIGGAKKSEGDRGFIHREPENSLGNTSGQRPARQQCPSVSAAESGTEPEYTVPLPGNPVISTRISGRPREHLYSRVGDGR